MPQSSLAPVGQRISHILPFPYVAHPGNTQAPWHCLSCEADATRPVCRVLRETRHG